GERFLVVRENFQFQRVSGIDSFALLFNELTKPVVLSDGREGVAREGIMAYSLEYFRELLACDPDTGETIIATSAGNRELNPIDWLPDLDSTQTVLRRFNIIARFNTPAGQRIDEPVVLPFCKDPGVYTAVFSRDLSLSAATKTTLQQLPQVTVYKDDTKQ